MNAFSGVLSSLADCEGGYEVVLGDEWRQGRTAYGGLTAALALAAARRAVPSLPPLRSMHVSFTGPAIGPCTFAVERIAGGRSTVFVEVRMYAESRRVLQAQFCFATGRESKLRHSALWAPEAPEPESCAPFFVGDFIPRCASNFDGRIAGGQLPLTGAAVPEILVWLRHRDRSAPDDLVSIVALADAPPPGAMTMMREPAPLSTITWAVDVLTSEVVGADWYLSRTMGESMADGYGSQSMYLWDQAGRPVLAGRQTVAIYL